MLKSNEKQIESHCTDNVSYNNGNIDTYVKKDIIQEQPDVTSANKEML